MIATLTDALPGAIALIAIIISFACALDITAQLNGRAA